MGLGIDAAVLSATRTQELGPRQVGLLAEAGATDAVATLVDRLVNRLGRERVLRLCPDPSHIPERAVRRVPALDPAGAESSAADAGVSPWGQARASLRPSQSRHSLHRQSSWPLARTGQLPRPCLLLQPPEPILVMAEMPEGPPARFVWRRVARRIVAAEGPERIAPEWWRGLAVAPAAAPAAPIAVSPIAVSPMAVSPMAVSMAGAARTRDYYRVEDDSGARYWVFRDGLYQQPGEANGPPRWYLHGLSA